MDVVVNTTMSCVIKLHRQYVLSCSDLLVIGVIEHRGQRSPKGEGFVTTLGCIFYVNKIRPRSWDTNSNLNVGKNIVMGITCD